MLDFETLSKLETCLKNAGFNYDFSIDDNHFFDGSYGKYKSLTLRSITGISNNIIEQNDSEHSSLFKEMEEARNSFFDQIGEDCCTNHTKSLESERLYIKPNNKEDGRSIYEYVNKYDKDEYLFARMSRNCGSEDYFIFCLCLKETNEIIGDIGLAFDPNQQNTFNLSYYIKIEHRKKVILRKLSKRF